MPGKFEGNADEVLAEYLYERAMNGWQDEDKGESDYSGWHTLFIFGNGFKAAPMRRNFDSTDVIEAPDPIKPAYVCTEDSNGFFTCVAFETVEGARTYYDALPDWGANDAVIDMTTVTDIYGREWEYPESELCPSCKQPDNVGDCNHNRLSDADVEQIRNG